MSDILVNMLGLDEFQAIAAYELLRDLEGYTWPPAPGSEHEKKLMELGAIVMGERSMEELVRELEGGTDEG